MSKFIHVSTTDVYGYPDYPADETAPYRLRNWQYGDTKIEGEKLVWAYYHQHSLPVTVVRPASIYGPRSATFVLEIVKLLKSGDMAYIGRGPNPAGLAYVTNVVDMLLPFLCTKVPIQVGETKFRLLLHPVVPPAV